MVKIPLSVDWKWQLKQALKFLKPQNYEDKTCIKWKLEMIQYVSVSQALKIAYSVLHICFNCVRTEKR